MDTVSPSARDRIAPAAVEPAGQDGVHRVATSAVAARSADVPDGDADLVEVLPDHLDLLLHGAVHPQAR